MYCTSRCSETAVVQQPLGVEKQPGIDREEINEPIKGVFQVEGDGFRTGNVNGEELFSIIPRSCWLGLIRAVGI